MSRGGTWEIHFRRWGETYHLTPPNICFRILPQLAAEWARSRTHARRDARGRAGHFLPLLLGTVSLPAHARASAPPAQTRPSSLAQAGTVRVSCAQTCLAAAIKFEPRLIPGSQCHWIKGQLRRLPEGHPSLLAPGSHSHGHGSDGALLLTLHGRWPAVVTATPAGRGAWRRE